MKYAINSFWFYLFMVFKLCCYKKFSIFNFSPHVARVISSLSVEYQSIRRIGLKFKRNWICMQALLWSEAQSITGFAIKKSSRCSCEQKCIYIYILHHMSMSWTFQSNNNVSVLFFLIHYVIVSFYTKHPKFPGLPVTTFGFYHQITNNFPVFCESSRFHHIRQCSDLRYLSMQIFLFTKLSSFF